jgi:hypothetical protein
MKVLELIQEAARRLTIMIPKSVIQTASDTSEIDYDANLLVSCLNATIKQNMTLNLFNRQILHKSINLLFNPAVYFLNNYVDKNPVYSDFVINLSYITPDLEELMGDGFSVSIYELNEPTLYKKKSYLFRQLTATDYLRLKRTCLPSQSSSDEKNRSSDVTFSSFKSLRKEIKEYKKNMPSENKTNMLNADNMESGFIIFGNSQSNKIAYFCNSMVSNEDISQEGGMFQQPPTLEFLYRTNYGVITDMGERVDSIPPDVPQPSPTDPPPPPPPPIEIPPNNYELVIPDELAILGTIINYKSYYGLDYSLDLGQYKQMMDQLKENQENIQITHLEKTQYYPIRNV